MADAWKDKEAADNEEANEKRKEGDPRRAGHIYTRGGDLNDGDRLKEMRSASAWFGRKLLVSVLMCGKSVVRPSHHRVTIAERRWRLASSAPWPSVPNLFQQWRHALRSSNTYIAHGGFVKPDGHTYASLSFFLFPGFPPSPRPLGTSFLLLTIKSATTHKQAQHQTPTYSKAFTSSSSPGFARFQPWTRT